MVEHLFKLKKDGKMVGYMCLFGAYARYKPYLFDKEWLHQRAFENQINTSVTTLTAYSFVTKDKHGKNVFAGDEVIYRPPDIDELCQDEEEKLEASVAGGFLVFDIEGTDFVEASKFGDIELIEENKDA